MLRVCSFQSWPCFGGSGGWRGGVRCVCGWVGGGGAASTAVGDHTGYVYNIPTLKIQFHF